MPFRARGRQVQKKKGGRWLKLSNEKSEEAARRKAAKLNILMKRGELE